ncbi:MAG: Uma2 family endonuclease [Caldilineaceae bacterium]|nr:Uma2 family endonuclease [Caldilineaceae bacterium]
MAVTEMVQPPKFKYKPAWQFETPIDTSETEAMLAALAQLDLPSEDGEPMENARERVQINLTIELIDQCWHDRDDYFVGGNMFVYFSTDQARQVTAEINDPSLPKKTFRGPDVFVVQNVDGNRQRQKWVVWEEDGQYPGVIFEFLSPSTRGRDLTDKKTLYERTFQTREYFCYEYMDQVVVPRLYGWRLNAQGHYQPLTPNEQGWLWSEELQLWVGEWYGEMARETTLWMRFYTVDGELVPTQTEIAEQRAAQAEAEAAALRAELARLRKEN